MTFGDDDTGEQIAPFENEYKCNADKINLRVGSGKGRQPVTWATLVA